MKNLKIYLFLLIVLILNPIALPLLIPSITGKSISTAASIILICFDSFIVFNLIMFSTKWKTDKQKKKIKLTYIMIFLMFIFIESGLQIANLVISAVKPQKINNPLFNNDPDYKDPRLFLSPYKDKPWAEQMWHEFHQIKRSYRPFLMWDREEFHGQYVNVDPERKRKTWEPDKYDIDKPAEIFFFGGSTAWGTGARDNFTIPSLLSKKLNEERSIYKVSNYGEYAYTFQQNVMELILLLKDGKRPKYVIFYEGHNDIYCSYQAGKAGATSNESILRQKFNNQNPTFSSYVKSIINYISDKCLTIKLVNQIASRNTAANEVAAKYTDEQMVRLAKDISEDLLSSMQLVNELARTYSFVPILALQPSLFTEINATDEELEAGNKFKDSPVTNLFQEVLLNINSSNKNNIIDINQCLSKRNTSVYLDSCHLSEEGNQIVTEEILQKIIFTR